ncbi:hypothetical protein DSO57_1019457 [Entomophthora muscae]|uniref:Uncharacterized protein n=1 Tax=Entomophthora muscae TaxID=34485 RepID=A0ACC2TRM4_9FUNG|nr:hypothetical protein DSO57_1019457 [Entomophthora muscae]
MEFALPTEVLISRWYEDSHMLPPLESVCPSGILLMGLNMYLTQLSHVGSFWSPVQVVIPFLHWVTSCGISC